MMHQKPVPPETAAQDASTVMRLETAMARAKASARTYVIVIDTDPDISTEAGGAWWDVAVPEVSERSAVGAARAEYEAHIKARE